MQLASCGFIPWLTTKMSEVQTLIHGSAWVVAIALVLIAAAKFRTLVAIGSAAVVGSLIVWLVVGGGIQWGANQTIGETGGSANAAVVAPAPSISGTSC
jgi:hypothetical protein